MNKRINNILITIAILLFFAFICFLIYYVNDFITDYQCSTMPIDEFFQTEKCEKYWRYR